MPEPTPDSGALPDSAAVMPIPFSREGRHPELAADFWLETAYEPLDERRLAEHCRQYCAAHLERLVPVLLPDSEAPSFNEALQEFWLHPRAVRELGLAYWVREAKLTGDMRLYQRADGHPEGRLVAEEGVALDDEHVNVHQLMALEFLSRNLRLDTAGDTTQYFYMPEQRYLSANDLGESGEANDLEALFEATADYFEAVRDNLGVHAGAVAARLKGENGEVVDRSALVAEVVREVDTDPDTAELVFAEESMDRLFRAVAEYDPGLAELIVRKSELFEEFVGPGNDAFQREGSFGKAFFTFEGLMRRSNRYWVHEFLLIDESAPPRLHAVRSEALDLRLPYDPARHSLPDISTAVQVIIQSYLAHEAAAERADTAELFDRFASDDFPDLYPALYVMLRHFGPDLTERILAGHNAPELLTGFDLIWQAHRDLRDLPESDIRERLRNAGMMAGHNIVQYVRGDDAELREFRRSPDTPGEKISAYWAEAHDRAEMILQRVRVWSEWSREGIEDSLDRFRGWWELLDYEIPDLPDSEIVRGMAWRRDEAHYLVMSYQKIVDPDGELSSAELRLARSEFISGLIGAMKEGYDPRYAVMVPDLEAHLRMLADGGAADRATGLKEFELFDQIPDNVRSELRPGEERIFQGDAAKLLSEFDDFPIARLAAWRAERDPAWTELLEGAAWNYDTLQFELALTHEWNEPYREQVRAALEQVDHVTVRKLYEIIKPHDVVTAMDRATAWVNTDSGLPPEDLRALLLSASNVAELMEMTEWLGDYRLADDPLAEPLGAPRSLRTLQSRLSAEPEQIGKVYRELGDRPEWKPVVAAPGFDFGALIEIGEHPEFKRLRDGELDETQPFRPAVERFLERPLHELVYEALGSFRQGIPGKAADPKKLYHVLKHWLREHDAGVTVGDLARKEIPTELEAGIIEILRAHEAYPGQLLQDITTARLHAKSDPRGWVSGNWTDCCIPFGRSLTSDYMVNPATQFFTVSRRDRVVAQSVVVDAIDRETGCPTVVLDNIEIANNYQRERPEIEQAYRAFWDRAYPGRPVLIGAQPNDPTLGSQELVDARRYQSAAPLDYSDGWRFKMYRVRGPIGEPEVDIRGKLG